ncbi:MAG: type IX secretion system sortase PorU, partial [Bacteroidetes bacterium]|nr:type IX secretion system sortase PorU [Bacteroidota bacterium]
DVRRLGVQPDGNGYRVEVAAADTTQPREILAFTEAAVRSLDAEALCPDGACRVPPQNLHGIAQFPEFVIVTPAAFQEAAQALAEHRRQRDGMTVQVTQVEQIYNEFSGGQMDPRAIRDYFRFLYDRGPGDDPALRYALLMGDGHYNYRQLGQEPPALTNWLPPYQTEESFDPDRSYTSDDYFGLLDPIEGRWVYTFYTSPGPLEERVDIGIGRMPVQSLTEAQRMVDKIRRYEDPSNYGAWRSRYLFIADDGFNGQSATLERSPDLHTQNIEVAAQQVDAVEPSLNQQKVYAISYPRVFLNGWRIPGAKSDVMASLREGVLVANYSGHGGEFGLAQEEVFTREDARTLDNGDRMPVFITATCSFGRWDLAGEQSGAEELMLNEQGGAIALLTTVRTVYTRGGTTSLNVGLNRQLNEDLFRRDDEGLPLRLGDALRLTKNTEVGIEGNNRKFNLLGDPTMRLGLPPRKTVVTSVNDTPVDEQTAQIRALDRLTLQGEVQTLDGQLDPTFDGTVNVSILDARRQVQIDPEFVSLLRDRPYYFVREDLIWRGRVQAEGGQFEATFVVPKDISYSDQPGRISAYAASSGTQAFGFTENVVVGGTAENPPDDDTGPAIDLYVNSDNFVSGGLTPPQPRVLIDLYDDSGINTVGAGVGHEMLLIVDGDEQNAIDIGDLYESEEDSYQRGRVEYTFEEPLSPGPHTLTVRAWDVLNNSGTAEVDLVVSDAGDLELANVFNYPNPTTGPTRFVFEHNQPLGTAAAVQVRIYSLSGRPVATLERDLLLEGGPTQIVWDGLDDDFDRLAPGIYLYKLRVEVDGLDGERHVSERLERLAVVR